MTRTIPQIRERLFELADELDCPELIRLAEETRRRPPVRKGPVKSRPINRQVRVAIVAYAAAHPDAHGQEIAAVFKVNHGRVSEALGGKRTG